MTLLQLETLITIAGTLMLLPAGGGLAWIGATEMRLRAVRRAQAAALGHQRRNTPSALGRSKDMNRLVRFVLDDLQVPFGARV